MISVAEILSDYWNKWRLIFTLIEKSEMIQPINQDTDKRNN